MKDTTAQNEHNSQERTEEDGPAAYTPEQRRMFRKVAIRSYIRKHGDASPLPEAAPDGGEEAS